EGEWGRRGGCVPPLTSTAPGPQLAASPARKEGSREEARSPTATTKLLPGPAIPAPAVAAVRGVDGPASDGPVCAQAARLHLADAGSVEAPGRRADRQPATPTAPAARNPRYLRSPSRDGTQRRF